MNIDKQKKVESIQVILIYVSAIILFLLLYPLGRRLYVEGNMQGHINTANLGIFIGIMAYVILGIATGLNKVVMMLRKKVKFGFHFIQVVIVLIFLIYISLAFRDSITINACIMLGSSCIMNGFYQKEV